MTTPSAPQNALEQLLLNARNGTVGIDEFMNTLIESEVIMPVNEGLNIGGFQGSSTVPMSMQDDNGTNLLVIFTSADRARAFLKNFPEFQGEIVDTFKALLTMNGVGYGVTINPGEEIGIDLGPETVEQIVGLAQAESK